VIVCTRNEGLVRILRRAIRKAKSLKAWEVRKINVNGYNISVYFSTMEWVLTLVTG